MNGIPQEVEDWIRNQGKPFTIFFTPEKDIVFVWGDKPWKKFIEFDPKDLKGWLDPKRYGFESWDDFDPKNYPRSLLDPSTYENDPPENP